MYKLWYVPTPQAYTLCKSQAMSQREISSTLVLSLFILSSWNVLYTLSSNFGVWEREIQGIFGELNITSYVKHWVYLQVLHMCKSLQEHKHTKEWVTFGLAEKRSGLI